MQKRPALRRNLLLLVQLVVGRPEGDGEASSQEKHELHRECTLVPVVERHVIKDGVLGMSMGPTGVLENGTEDGGSGCARRSKFRLRAGRFCISTLILE